MPTIAAVSDAGPERAAAPPRVAGLRPLGRVAGSIRPPGSKSIAQRALGLASLCGGAVRIAGLPEGADVAAARSLVRAVGARVEDVAPAAVRVIGAAPGPSRGWRAHGPLELGESGTLFRIALAGCALCGRAGERFELAAAGSLRRRGSAPLLEALCGAGVSIERREWPIAVRAIGPPSAIALSNPVSSQEVTALLIALAAWPGEHVLDVTGEVPSRPYVELTVQLLARFGVGVVREPYAGGERFVVRGPLRAPADPLAIEADASLGAVALAAGCLGGGEVTVTGVGARSVQGDVRIVEHLRAFGCRAIARDDCLVASGFPQRRARLDLAGEPDLAPVLAIVAAAAALAAREGERESTLTGLGTLPGKESSRIDVLARGLAQAGWRVQASEHSLAIGAPSGPRPSEPLALDAAGDHRMAFAFALLGLVRDGVDVLDAGAVVKSWPSFWADLARLRA